MQCRPLFPPRIARLLTRNLAVREETLDGNLRPLGPTCHLSFPTRFRENEPP